uniref:Chromosome partition protein Smc n=1 Tax=Schlesneria paludicola TaxID=360056 RepID=A0A7C2PCK9_9PLAN
MLKALELYGFKSFADRTRFDFAAGITGVVGPNGSGKSNVVDALKWILGDQSAKSLRGQEMTDVIFNGSASRKACSYAEAFLTIDNSQKFLPVDDVEVVIGRRLYRSGDAEYLVNRQPARLKDIRDLLLGTGAGNAAYCIIEQGRVDQILQANPSARRTVFEEAAGISRFKSRRVEAQRKLERVAQNLQRLTDIVDEVEGRLNTTRSQAAKAVKYREVSTELEQWWIGLAADDHRALTAQRTGVQQGLQSMAARLADLAEQQRVCDEGEAGFDRELSQVEARLREAERKLAAHREGLASEEASVRFQSSRLAELTTELGRIREQFVLLERRVVDAENELAAARQERDEVERETARLMSRLSAQDQQLQAAGQQLLRAQQQLEAARARQFELAKAVSAAEQAVLGWQAQQDLARQSQLRLNVRIDELREELSACERRRDELRRAYEAAQQDWEATQHEHRQRMGEQQSLAARTQQAREALANLREARSAAVARKGLLEDLELRQEGLGIGVRELLHRARHAQAPPWNTILGGVADLLDVDLEHAGLIEVALGPRAQLLVLREFQPLLDYLSQSSVTLTGRVGFVAVPDHSLSQPLPPHRRSSQLVHLLDASASGPDLTGRPGVVSRADRLVISEHGVTGLAAALLADTWIVTDLDAAIALATSSGRGQRFVTLQGELVDHQGVLQFGTVRSETSLLSRKSELRRIKNDLLRLERDIALREAEHNQLLADLTDAEQQLAAAAGQLETLNPSVTLALTAWRASDQDAERCQREMESVLSQLQGAEDDLARQERALRQAEAEWAERRAEWEQVAGEAAAAEAAVAVATQAAQAVQEHKASEQMDLVRQAQQRDMLQATIVRLEHEVQQRQLQRDEGHRRAMAAQSKTRQVSLQLLNARATLADGYRELDALLREVNAVVDEKERLRRQRAEFVEHELRLRRERRELQEQRHAAELQLREVDQTLATLTERIRDEYQIDLADAAAQGASAVALFHAERHAASSGEAAESDSAETVSPRVLPEAPLDFAELRPELESRVVRLRKRLKLLGNVNTDSLRDLEQIEQRFEQLSTQLQDLVEAKAALEDIIRRINQESRRMFAETFQTIRANFQHLFRKVFGGGEGDIVLEDPEDILECGIEITARPPGKELRSLTLLSGGEKTMTAIALIMAIFQAKPSPFCILDEVDAALDEANVDRYTAVLKEFQQTTQFIMITHHKRSMTVADVLYGVTMEESGVSKRMSVRFEDISEDGQFRQASAAAA